VPTSDSQFGPHIVPATPTPWLRKGFAKRVVMPMFRKNWNALRLAKPLTDQPLLDLQSHPGPALIIMNHQSWWDPLIGLYLAHRYFPSRPGLAPMDKTQLAKLGIFKRLGIFGIDPDAPASLNALRKYLTHEWQQHPSSILWITPQGKFSDPTQPIVLKPGAAAIALAAQQAGLPMRIIAVAIEMPFWTSRHPELLLNIREATPTSTPTTLSLYNQHLTQALQCAADELRSIATTRDESRFLTIDGRQKPTTNFFYDFYLRLRGRDATITDQHRQSAKPASSKPA
jgi:1-acyl-sn-glycerol-3-phosphate acyltransferase